MSYCLVAFHDPLAASYSLDTLPPTAYVDLRPSLAGLGPYRSCWNVSQKRSSEADQRGGMEEGNERGGQIFGLLNSENH